MAEKKQYYCEKCNKTMAAEQFYTSNNLEKYEKSDGKLPQCKKCITMHVDNFNPDSFLWILQEVDVPWIPDEWDKLILKYGKDKSKMTGTTILGRYLSKMKLNQYKDYRWKDTAFLQEYAKNKLEQTMKLQGYDAASITMAVDRMSFDVPEGELREPDHPVLHLDPSDFEPAQPHFQQEEELDLGLSQEDITYLRLKWGKTYKQEEWVKLEQLYNEMCESYDIQTAGHIDTLKLICKTSLKANQLVDLGDVEGFQKMSKVYDTLMKSGKFTAAQNKAESGEFIDSIGELVELCEKEGYIERYYIDKPNDKVDATIKDMQKYTKTLIEKETNLSALIENAVKQNLKEDEDSSNSDGADIDVIFDDLEQELLDSDFEEFSEFLEQEELDTEELLEEEY